MSTLVVIEYDDQFKAEEVRLSLMKLQKEYLIDLEDAVVAVKDQKGKGRVPQGGKLKTAGGRGGGVFWGAGRADLFEPTSRHGPRSYRWRSLRRAHRCRHK